MVRQQISLGIGLRAATWEVQGEETDTLHYTHAPFRAEVRSEPFSGVGNRDIAEMRSSALEGWRAAKTTCSYYYAGSGTLAQGDAERDAMETGMKTGMETAMAEALKVSYDNQGKNR